MIGVITPNSLEAEIGGQCGIASERAVYGRSGIERDMGAQVIPASLTQITPATGHSWLEGNSITCKIVARNVTDAAPSSNTTIT